jgi:single-stranded-DNA-specific exonuclease
MDKPDLALALLLAKTDHEAARLAKEVEVHSARRKEVERAVLAEALEAMKDPAMAALPGIVLAKQGWHPGVVGIVAGRLVSRFGKPAVVIALDGATGRGSARTPAGFSVYDAPVADARLETSDLPARVVHDLARFEPCGEANPAPRVALDGVRVLQAREMRGGHMRLWLDVAGQPLSCFGPEMGPLLGKLGDRVRLVGLLRRDTYTGGNAVEVRLLGVEPA